MRLGLIIAFLAATVSPTLASVLNATTVTTANYNFKPAICEHEDKYRLPNQVADHLEGCLSAVERAGRFMETECGSLDSRLVLRGHQWRSASDCFKTCYKCLRDGIDKKAAKTRCYRKVLSAECTMEYMSWEHEGRKSHY